MLMSWDREFAKSIFDRHNDEEVSAAGTPLDVRKSGTHRKVGGLTVEKIERIETRDGKDYDFSKSFFFLINTDIILIRWFISSSRCSKSVFSRNHSSFDIRICASSSTADHLAIERKRIFPALVHCPLHSAIFDPIEMEARFI